MKMLKITLQGKMYEVGVEVIDGAAPVAYAPAAPVYAAPAPAVVVAPPPPPAPAPVAVAPAPAPVAGGHAVTSPMPGLVFKIGVAVGQQVAQDQELLVLEAMKMESPVYAHCAGTVAAILVKQGDAVSEGQVLIQLS
jgi:biotin carboxyl carrier protein